MDVRLADRGVRLSATGDPPFASPVPCCPRLGRRMLWLELPLRSDAARSVPEAPLADGVADATRWSTLPLPLLCCRRSPTISSGLITFAPPVRTISTMLAGRTPVRRFTTSPCE